MNAKTKKDVLSDIKIMTLFNTPMIDAVFSHKECVKELLYSLFEQHIHIRKTQTEYFVSNLHGKEARLDILVESIDHGFIDIEIQKENIEYLCKRARFYFSGMDNHVVEKGEFYEGMPDCYVIFICQKDQFKKGLPMYHIHNTVDETGERVNNGQELIIVNGEYRDESTLIGKLMHDFSCIDPNEMYSEVLKKWMKYYKQEKGGLEKMCEISEKWMKQGYEKGMIIGEEKGYENGLSDGITQGYENGKADGITNGKKEKATQMITNLLTKKLGSISEYVINKINDSDEMALDTLSLNIFDIDSEEDILRYVH